MRKYLLATVVFTLFLGFGSQAVAGKTAKNRPMDVSLPAFTLGPTELVVSFKCVVAGGGILKVKTPYLWYTNVDNGTSELSTLTANIIEGEAAFGKDDLVFFQNFVGVEKPGDLGPNDRPFDINVEIGIAKDSQMSAYRSLKFSRKQLIIKTVK